MDNDLGFLLIFIVLPTVLIVSGFWFFLLIRKDARIRELSQTARPEALSTQEPEVPKDEDLAPAFLVPIATLPDSLPAVSDVAAAQPAYADDDEEFWTLPDEVEFASVYELPDEPLADETPAHIEDIDRHSGFTEEIAPVDIDPDLRPFDPDFDVEPQGKSEDRRTAANAANESSGDGPEREESDEQSSDVEEPQNRQRRNPGSLLVPSSEFVRQRTNSAGRRAPQIPKSSSRDDEDAVEGPDGSRDT